MNDLSEENIRLNCPHCDQTSDAYTYLLETTQFFSVVCDYHPLLEGHLLIIPKKHLSCVGEYPEPLYQEFISLYKKYSEFIKSEYGAVSSFEHGKFGQSVFHSHIHLLPYDGNPKDIVPEGQAYLSKIENLSELKSILKRDGGYLFFSIGREDWIVEKNLTSPRFFRDRFAIALGHPERGDWKTMHVNQKAMITANRMNESVRKKFKIYTRQ